jgi:hypothetical protein
MCIVIGRKMDHQIKRFFELYSTAVEVLLDQVGTATLLQSPPFPDPVISAFSTRKRIWDCRTSCQVVLMTLISQHSYSEAKSTKGQ